MYMGHFGIALVGKGVRPEVPLWVFLTAAIAPDLTHAALTILPLDEPAIDLLAHSLPAAAFFTLILPLAYWLRTRSSSASWVVGLVAFSHIPADLVTSRLPSWPGGPEIGAHLYTNHLADFAVEAIVILAGWLIYRHSLTARLRTHHATWAVLALLLLLQAGFATLDFS